MASAAASSSHQAPALSSHQVPAAYVSEDSSASTLEVEFAFPTRSEQDAAHRVKAFITVPPHRTVLQVCEDLCKAAVLSGLLPECFHRSNAQVYQLPKGEPCTSLVHGRILLSSRLFSEQYRASEGTLYLHFSPPWHVSTGVSADASASASASSAVAPSGDLRKQQISEDFEKAFKGAFRGCSEDDRTLKDSDLDPESVPVHVPIAATPAQLREFMQHIAFYFKGFRHAYWKTVTTSPVALDVHAELDDYAMNPDMFGVVAMMPNGVECIVGCVIRNNIIEWSRCGRHGRLQSVAAVSAENAPRILSVLLNRHSLRDQFPFLVKTIRALAPSVVWDCAPLPGHAPYDFQRDFVAAVTLAISIATYDGQVVGTTRVRLIEELTNQPYHVIASARHMNGFLDASRDTAPSCNLHPDLRICSSIFDQERSLLQQAVDESPVRYPAASYLTLTELCLDPDASAAFDMVSLFLRRSHLLIKPIPVDTRLELLATLKRGRKVDQSCNSRLSEAELKGVYANGGDDLTSAEMGAPNFHRLRRDLLRNYLADNIDGLNMALAAMGKEVYLVGISTNDLCHPVIRSAYLWWIEGLATCISLKHQGTDRHAAIHHAATCIQDWALYRLTAELLELRVSVLISVNMGASSAGVGAGASTRNGVSAAAKKRRNRRNKKLNASAASAAAASAASSASVLPHETDSEQEQEDDSQLDFYAAAAVAEIAARTAEEEHDSLVQELVHASDASSSEVQAKAALLEKAHRDIAHLKSMMEQMGKCVVCMDGETVATVVLMPCKHLCLCASCAQSPALRTCPLCRKFIVQRISGVHLA